jgi:hypothetical protein
VQSKESLAYNLLPDYVYSALRSPSGPAAPAALPAPLRPLERKGRMLFDVLIPSEQKLQDQLWLWYQGPLLQGQPQYSRRPGRAPLL